MPIKRSQCYFVVCDGGDQCEDAEDSIHFDSAEDAQTYAEETGWVFFKKASWCAYCAPYCECDGTIADHKDKGKGPCTSDSCNVGCQKYNPRVCKEENI